jgi:hypothetical protein
MKLKIFFTVCIALLLTNISLVSAQQVFVPDDPSLFYQFIEKSDHNKIVVTKDFPGSWFDINRFNWRINAQYSYLRFYVVVDSMLMVFDMNRIQIFYPSGKTENSMVLYIDHLGVSTRDTIITPTGKNSIDSYADVKAKLVLNYGYSSPSDSQKNAWKKYGISMVDNSGKKIPMFEGEKLELSK